MKRNTNPFKWRHFNLNLFCFVSAGIAVISSRNATLKR